MKRYHLRKDKTCLNCGAIVPERYCSHCGQENTEPKESFGHLLHHFFADVTHYDSKLFTTIKDLIFKPGFLTKEYNAGKRISYLNPIRLYIFISAIFFLGMFSQGTEENTESTLTTAQQKFDLFRQHLADSLRKITATTGKVALKDSIRNNVYIRLAARLDTGSATPDTTESIGAFFNNNGIIIFRLQENKYANISEYDSMLRKLPAGSRDDIIMRYMIRKLVWLTHEKGHTNGLVITRNFKHDIPKIMFVLLPLFALFVGFFYSRKKYMYPQHAIFSLHFHSFAFIFLMLEGLVELALPMDKMWAIMLVITLLGIFIYLSVALHNVYRQALWLSAIKALGISILYIITLILSICILIVASFILLK